MLCGSASDDDFAGNFACHEGILEDIAKHLTDRKCINLEHEDCVFNFLAEHDLSIASNIIQLRPRLPPHFRDTDWYSFFASISGKVTRYQLLQSREGA